MNKDDWIKSIKKATKGIGTYQKEFDASINTLADILEQRDIAFAQYQSIAGTPLIINENEDSDGLTVKKNPALAIWNELNKSALTYWRELGLTPAGIKKINENSFAAQKNDNNLKEIMKKMQS